MEVFSVLIKNLIWVLLLISEQTDSQGPENWDLKLFTSELTIVSFLKTAFIKNQRTVKIFKPAFRPFWTTGLWKLENWGARPCLSLSMSVLWDLGNLPSFQTWTLSLSTLIPCRTKSVLFSIHTRTYTDTVSKGRIWAWRPAGRSKIFSHYISSGLCACREAHLGCNLVIFGITGVWQFCSNLKWRQLYFNWNTKNNSPCTHV